MTAPIRIELTAELALRMVGAVALAHLLGRFIGESLSGAALRDPEVHPDPENAATARTEGAVST
jgi:hypothetical protein